MQCENKMKVSACLLQSAKVLAYLLHIDLLHIIHKPNRGGAKW